jgi:DNA-binding winged helix-turn-helix (wHTH) protein
VGTIVLPDGLVDTEACVVRRAGNTFALTPIEHKLLVYLAERMGQVVRRDELLVHVWGYRPGLHTRSIDKTVHRLRQKIELDPAEPTLLRSMYGLGLVLDAPTEPARPAHSPVTDAPWGLAEAKALLVGRAREIELLGSPGARVVCVIGPPGVGKTRVAREFALGWQGEVQLVSLRDRTSVDEIVGALAHALGVSPPHAAPGAWLTRVMCHRRDTLWILDDAEAAAAALDALLPALECGLGPGSRLLVTSRVALRAGLVHRLEPLDPVDAAAMFVSEARRAEPTFALDRDDPDVRALVRQLDGLPLAIELAAARMAVLSVAELSARLADPWKMLRTSHSGERHRSLEAAIAVSYALLSPAEQAAFAQCSVFRGGFVLEAAEAVLDLGDLEPLVTAMVR